MTTFHILSGFGHLIRRRRSDILSKSGFRAGTQEFLLVNSSTYIRSLKVADFFHITNGTESYPTYRHLGHFDVLAAMLKLVRKGAKTVPEIAHYLRKCDCPFDLATIQFMFDAYTGTDYQSCLWSRDQGGQYTALDVPEEAPIKRRKR
jgi:hypothetical protein